ncbi:PREDICTED: uncharacterized protein LOC105562789 [Vollenhovia emeryi]|uniref:uncharacterized protein LOC105562789 n=1 Tax=Vollenhovia emeryi TaxID=411798 RepID=UPI0005F46BF2|nr:PREDICTED: uncharacterized protein LOC105562789 [Vollenhovia emeryi]
MAPTMSSRIAVRGIGLTLTLLLVSSAQAVNYEVHRHDVIATNLNGNVILTSRDYLEQLNFVAPKASYTLQEATEHLLQFGALLRARILDTFGRLLYVYYDDFSIAEVEALRKVYREILERQYDVLNLVPSVLRNPDTRPSRICAEIYDHAAQSCLRGSASVCRRIRRQHDLPHPDDRDTPALNVTYRIYRSSKISKQYPRGFSLATTLRFLQRQMLTVTPNLLSGLLQHVRYENYDDDVLIAERELVRHYREIATTREIPMPTKELSRFHTVNSFLKFYFDMYAKKFLDDDLKKHALLIARSIADDVGTIDENIHLLGNVYENRTIHVEYLFDLVLPDDLLESDVIEAKKYLVTKLKKFNVVEKYLRVQRYQQATPAQLMLEITEQLRDIDFAKSIATSLRMHAKFWRRSRMIESLDELLELFDTYENLRQVPRYLHMMRKIDWLKESLQAMKDVPVEILCNAPRACLRIGLQLVLHCQLVSTEIKDSIKEFIELSDVCVEPVRLIEESRRSMEIPFKISRTRVSTVLQTASTFLGETTTRRVYDRSTVEDRSETTESTESKESEVSDETTEAAPPKSSKERSSTESTRETTTTTTTAPRTTPEPTKPVATTRLEEEIFAAETTTAATTATTLPATTTSPATTTTPLPTTTTTLPATLSPTTTTLPTTMPLPTTTTTLPATLSPTTTTLPTTTTTTTMSPTTTTTVPSTTTTTALPTTTTTASPTTIGTTLPTTTTTASTTTASSTLLATTTASPTVTTELPIVDVVMKLEHSTIRTVNVPRAGITEPLRNLTVFTTPAPMRSCESNECEQSSEQSVEVTTALLSTTRSPTTTTAPTMRISTHEIIRETPSEPSSTYENFVSESAVSSTTELSKTPVTKGDNCVKSCLEGCKFKSESLETSVKSCETSCDSATEDCDGEDKSSPGCDRDCERNCATKEEAEKSAECMTLCPSDRVESASCEEGDCTTSAVPAVGMKLERTRTSRLMCEIRDPHHRRQLKRLARMRAISAAAAAVATSRLDVLRSSRRRDRIATKKLYNLSAAKLPYSKDRKMAGYVLEKRLGDSGDDKDWRRRKQTSGQAKRRLAKRFSRKLTQGTTLEEHRTRGTTPFRHSQIKRISGRGEESISA